MVSLDTYESSSLPKNQNLSAESPSNLTNPNFSGESILNLLNQLPSMVGYWDKNLRNKFVNKAYESWFSCNLNEIAGKHIREVIGEQLFELNLPYIEAVLEGMPQEFERAIPLHDGSGFRYSLANYIPDIRNNRVEGFYALVTDVSALKRAELELRKKQEALELSEKRYRGVVQAQTEIISRLKADGTYLFVNDSFCHFFGKPVEELIGLKWHPVVFPDDLSRVTQELAALSASNPIVRIENRVIASNGNIHWMQFINIGIFDKNGSLTEIQSVGRDITDQKLADQEIQALAFSDSLTGLPNRRLLLDRLQQAISWSWHNAEQGALLFIDLDKFKLINDRHGHDHGDLVLIEIVNRIKYCLRPEDTLARLGGDEFVVLIEHLSVDQGISSTVVSNIANKICEAVRHLINVNDINIYTSVSIGISLFGKNTDTLQAQLKQADKALYKAKAEGRNRIVFFDNQI